MRSRYTSSPQFSPMGSPFTTAPPRWAAQPVCAVRLASRAAALSARGENGFCRKNEGRPRLLRPLARVRAGSPRGGLSGPRSASRLPRGRAAETPGSAVLASPRSAAAGPEPRLSCCGKCAILVSCAAVVVSSSPREDFGVPGRCLRPPRRWGSGRPAERVLFPDAARQPRGLCGGVTVVPWFYGAGESVSPPQPRADVRPTLKRRLCRMRLGHGPSHPPPLCLRARVRAVRARQAPRSGRVSVDESASPAAGAAPRGSARCTVPRSCRPCPPPPPRRP